MFYLTVEVAVAHCRSKSNVYNLVYGPVLNLHIRHN